MPATDPDDLYGLPLDRFTDERNALAKRLRQEGRRDEAAGVSKLRKPSLAAWAVNQLVRTQKREVSGLFKAGDDFLVARDGRQMREHLRALLSEPQMARIISEHGLKAILDRHTCAHRVDELLNIHRELNA